MAGSIPATQRALKIKGAREVYIAENSIVPIPQDDEILVRVICVAINPFDSKAADLSPVVGATVGCDFSGEVVYKGPAVKRNLIIGDRVCGFVHGNNPDSHDDGAFAEYLTVPGDLVLRLPSAMSYKVATSLGVGLVTVGMALYLELNLPYPVAATVKPLVPMERSNEPNFVLVYGGGTATGGLAIQLLKRSGVRIVTTCSPRSSKRAKELGATETFDYRSPQCSSDIRTFTQNSLAYAFDCITDSTSMRICYGAISTKGGRYMALDVYPTRSHTRRNVKPGWILAFTMFNKPINMVGPYARKPRPKDRAFAERWFEYSESLLDVGLIEAHPVEERGGGLEGVINGLNVVRRGELSGVKLIYRIADDVLT